LGARHFFDTTSTIERVAEIRLAQVAARWASGVHPGRNGRVTVQALVGRIRRNGGCGHDTSRSGGDDAGTGKAEIGGTGELWRRHNSVVHASTNSTVVIGKFRRGRADILVRITRGRRHALVGVAIRLVSRLKSIAVGWVGTKASRSRALWLRRANT
jgi:hypothetical protein